MSTGDPVPWAQGWWTLVKSSSKWCKVTSAALKFVTLRAKRLTHADRCDLAASMLERTSMQVLLKAERAERAVDVAADIGELERAGHMIAETAMRLAREGMNAADLDSGAEEEE